MVDRSALADRIEASSGRRPLRLTPLGGGSTVDIVKVAFADGPPLVAKWADPPERGHLVLERRMLEDLARDTALPVPAVIHGDAALLLMDHIANDGGAPGEQAQADLAATLAHLHAVPRPCFGYEYDTTIGQLPQPNPKGTRWLDFFREHRLLHMTRAGHAEGSVSAGLRRRLEVLAARLERYLEEPAAPCLIHGDIWGGNVLCRDGRLAGLIDPALYYGHREIELAFATLFNTIGPPFFRHYEEHHALDAGFFEIRRDIYNIYPLLVHVRYWDRTYARPIEATLSRLGL